MNKENRIKIAFVEKASPFDNKLGGVLTYIFHRAQILSNNNFLVYWTDGFRVAYYDKELMTWNLIKEFKIKVVTKLKIIIFRLAYFLPGIRYLIDEIKIDLIEFPDSFSYFIKPLKKKCKVIVHCHTSFPTREFLNGNKLKFQYLLHKHFIRKNLLSANKILACSYEIALLTAGFFKVHLDNFNVINHSFSKNLFTISNCKEDINNTEKYFITIANSEFFKGIDLLINSFLEYKNRGGKNKLFIVGQKNLLDVPTQVRKKWLELGTDKLVEKAYNSGLSFVPYLGKEDVLILMSRACATIVLSRFDAFTMVVGEAASVGSPLIISNRTGWNNLINRFNAGILVNPYDIDDVVNAMFEIENPENNKQYSRRIKLLFDYISSELLIKKTIKEYLI